MSSIYMPASAVIISVILLVVYCVKDKIKIKENDIYLGMLVCILLDSLFVSAIFINAGEGESVTLTKFLNRCDYVALVVWSSCLCRYVHMVIHKRDDRPEKFEITRKVISGVTLFECALIWILRIEAVMENGLAKAITGPAVFFTFGCCALNLVTCLTIILLNIRKVTKQVVPVFMFLGIAAICAVTYYFDPNISGVSMGLAIVNMTMYFTIENPDVQMLEAVNLSREEALRANQAKTDFLSSMSHEIRTPINAIVGFAHCIENDETLDLAKQDAKDIINASENLLELINGILDISKIEAGKIEIDNREYDLVDTAEKLSKLIRARIGEKPIELRVSLAKDIPGVLFGDETKIRQVMTNLLTNAVKYTETGFIDYAIDCNAEDDVAYLTIAVSDTGHGIKEDVIGTLFNKFERLEEDRNSNIEGTGLGLAITKQFAEMLDGTIDVQSIYGYGSTFTFRVAQKIVSYERRATEKAVETQKEYPDRRILLVDDTAMNLVVAKRLLDLYKLEVDTASSGEECIAKCHSQNYDMILLDDMMPKMSGTETLGILKGDNSFDTPVVAFTANAIDGMRDNYINDGYSDYLSKPLVKDEMNRVLDKFLG